MAPEERGTRKLAAIMFTDIKGFSKKMGEDETVAMALLKAHDSMMQELFDKYSGRVIKSIGDSFMVDFSSAVNAVKCAIEAQEILWYYNRGKEELERIEVRIGVHLGDVITDGNDIYGDGVNIASRIEAFTQPNRICISQDIFNQVKNKMQIRAARMGSMDFKNIAEPVEVYEVLIDSIPEFAEPSHKPEEAPSRKKVEAATRQSAKEAKMIEEVKQAPKDDKQLKEEEERRQKVQDHYAKAEKFFVDGDYDNAEAEIREIFKLVALHGGAQILQNRIEEERFKKLESERLKQAEEERRKYQEDEKKIADLVQEAIDLVEKEEFNAALEKIKAVYKIDRHSSDAHRLEEQIQQALTAKEELASTEEQIAEDKAREQELLEALAAPKAPSRFRLAADRTQQVRRLLLILAGVVLIGLIGLSIRFSSEISSFFFTRSSSMVVIPFAVYPREADTMRLGEAISDIVINDLSRYAPLTVISTQSSYKFNSAGMNPLEYATSLQVETALIGDVRPQAQGFGWNLQLLRTEDGALLWQGKLETDLVQFHVARKSLVENVLRSLELAATPREIRPDTRAVSSYQAYLESLWYVKQYRSDYVRYGLGLLREAITRDTLFAAAYAAYGEASLIYYKLTGDRSPSFLRDALQFSQYAVQLNPDIPGAHATIAGALLYNQRFEDVMRSIRTSLALSPSNASALREHTLLSLIAGDFEFAEQQALKALALDPKNPEGNLALAHVYHFTQRYPEAIFQYGLAIVNGGSDSLISTRYVMNAWTAAGESERAVQFIRRVIGQNPTGYMTRYWTGRVLQLSGKIREAQPYLDDAVEQIEDLLEYSPNDANARIYLALCYSRLGRFAEGLREIDRVVGAIPGSHEVHYRKANVLAIQNKKSEALEWLKKAVDLKFEFEEVLSPEFVFLSKEPGFRDATVPARISGLRLEQ